MVDIQKTDFVLKNNKVIYPPVTTDGLELYYDATGKTNTDYHKDKLIDMSGKARHGNLTGFSYNQSSGFTEKEGDAGLVFDQIDDTLTLPAITPALNPNNYSMQINNNIFSFDNGKTKVVIDGEVIELPENLILNGDFNQGLTGWHGTIATISVSSNSTLIMTPTGTASRLGQVGRYTEVGNTYYYRVELKASGSTPNIYPTEPVGNGEKITGNGQLETISIIHKPTIASAEIRFAYNGTIGIPIEVINILQLNLTATFGAGKEPTKETMDALIERVGWYPSPKDYINRLTYKDNPFGDMEQSIDSADRDVLVGSSSIFTDKADEDGLVHVGVAGKSSQRKINLKNLALNPNVVSSWANNSTKKIELSSGWIVAEANTSISATVQSLSLTNIEFLLGHHYYISFKNKGDGVTAADTVRLRQAFAVSGYPIAAFNTGTDTSWNAIGAMEQTSSVVRVCTIGGKAGAYINYNYPVGTNMSGVKYSLKDLIVIDLTAYFGAGNEPTKEQMDTLIARTGWFEDEKEVALPEEITAQPSPDYPIEIKSLNDFDVVSDIGRNYILNSANLSASGLGATPGTSAEYRKINVGQSYMDIEHGTDVIISFDVKMDIQKANPTIMVYNSNSRGVKNIGNKAININGSVGEIVEGRYSVATNITDHTSPMYGYNTIEFYSIYGTNNFFEITNLKLEKGSTATPYSQAPEDIDSDESGIGVYKTNILLDEPLRSVGDVKDRLFRDTVDGLWKVERNVRELILDPNMIVQYSSVPVVGFTKFYTTELGISGSVDNRYKLNSPLLSNHFKMLPMNQGYLGNIVGISTYSSRTAIYGMLETTTLTSHTTAGLKEWFTKNPTTVLFAHETPFTTLLPQPLQDKLNNIASYKDSNYVYTVDKSGILEPTLNAIFKAKDWVKKEKTINSLRIWSKALTNQELLHNYYLEKERFRLGEYPAAGTSNTNLMLYNGGLERSALHFNYDLTI